MLAASSILRGASLQSSFPRDRVTTRLEYRRSQTKTAETIGMRMDTATMAGPRVSTPGGVVADMAEVIHSRLLLGSRLDGVTMLTRRVPEKLVHMQGTRKG